MQSALWGITTFMIINLQYKFENTKGIIRSRISKKNRQHVAQKKKNKRTNNDLPNITKDRVTRTSLKNGGELRCFGRVNSFCSTSDTRDANLVTNPMISHERGKDRGLLTTSGTYPWSYLTHIFHNGQPGHQISKGIVTACNYMNGNDVQHIIWKIRVINRMS